MKARCAALRLAVAPDSDAEDDDERSELGSPNRQSVAMSDVETPVRGGVTEQEEDTYPQGTVVTQETDENSSSMPRPSQTASSSSRKKARLVMRDGGTELPRAAWDTDDVADIFEQRSLGLGASSNNGSKKLVRKTNIGGDSDGDDDLFDHDDEPQEQTRSITAVKRSLQIDSDDEE